jgi:hypothetical protein
MVLVPDFWGSIGKITDLKVGISVAKESHNAGIFLDETQ